MTPHMSVVRHVCAARATHGNALHRTALHYTVLCCTALRCAAPHCAALHCTALLASITVCRDAFPSSQCPHPICVLPTPGTPPVTVGEEEGGEASQSSAGSQLHRQLGAKRLKGKKSTRARLAHNTVLQLHRPLCTCESALEAF